MITLERIKSKLCIIGLILAVGAGAFDTTTEFQFGKHGYKGHSELFTNITSSNLQLSNSVKMHAQFELEIYKFGGKRIVWYNVYIGNNISYRMNSQNMYNFVRKDGTVTLYQNKRSKILQSWQSPDPVGFRVTSLSNLDGLRVKFMLNQKMPVVESDEEVAAKLAKKRSKITSKSSQEIESMLSYLKMMQPPVVIGTKKYSGLKLHSHLKKQFAKNKDSILSADKFLNDYATKSKSGKAYYVTKLDGSKVMLKVWMRDYLMKLRVKR